MSEFLFLYRGGESGRSPEKMQEMMQNMLAWVSTPQGAVTMALFVVLVFVVLSAAGGAVGASLFGQRHQPH